MKIGRQLIEKFQSFSSANSPHCMSTTLKLFSAFYLCGLFPEQSEQPILVFLNQAKANEHLKWCKYEIKTMENPLMYRF
jgi:hypothetical protein